MRRVVIIALSLSCISVCAQRTPQPLPESWFDDDEWRLLVQHIISADELATYSRSRTAVERDAFIARFWTRRDPTPGTAVNEFRDEFMRRVDYANAHFGNPADPAHSGMETDRGRVHVLLGAPAAIDRLPGGAREVWNYEPAAGEISTLSVEFAVPSGATCDGTYRLVSRAVASFKGASAHVEIYPRRFVTMRIPADFTKVSSIAHLLRRADGSPFLENDTAILDGQIGPAGNDPLSRHFLTCRMFESDGMGFTHPLPPGSYTFFSTMTMTSGEIERDRVVFEVR